MSVSPQRRLPLTSTVAVAPRTVRLSLTDRCDLACVYCRPSRSDGYFEKRLPDEAWPTVIEGLLRAGVRRVRITGGEPLLHPRVVDVIRYLASQRIDDLALTTNATQLARLARPLKEAGLHRLTVSLDTLDEARFWRITRGGNLAQVLEGIDAALACGFREMKLNTVVVRGENDDELEAIARWSWERGITPRFIEVMRIGEGARLPESALVGHDEMVARLAGLVDPGEARRDPDRGPAKYLHAKHDRRLRVGFITGTTDTYCAGCDRLRVSADGTFRPCLATNDGEPGYAAAAKGDVPAVVRAIEDAWLKKPDGETWKGCTEATAAGVSMRATGG
jgi:cyclic pyranopterin phosphate synthase